MHSSQAQFPILINGGGMVGLTLALALSEAGFAVRVLDAGAPSVLPAEAAAALGVADFDTRVSALTIASQRLLQQLGVWPLLSRLRLCPYYDMQVWDADGTGRIHFAAEEVQAEVLGHIVENRLLCAALEQALAQRPEVELLHQERLASFTHGDDGWVVQSHSGKQYLCELVIGADGGQSTVRDLAGFTTRRWSYEQRAIVCTVQSAKPHQFTAWQNFLSSGPLALLPLLAPGHDEQHFSSIVWSCEQKLAEELLMLDDAGFAQRLTRASESVLGAMVAVGPRSAFPLQQQHARDYVQAGVALVGDAAHTIHPLAGQGVNLGFADVSALVQTLAAAQQRGEVISSLQTLSRYQRQRKASNLGMMLAMEAFKQGFGSQVLPVRWLRNAGLKFTSQTLPLKQLLMQQALGLS